MRQQEADEPASTRSVERELAERAQLAQERQLELLSAAREAPSSAALADVSAVGAASDAEHAALLQDQLDAEASRELALTLEASEKFHAASLEQLEASAAAMRAPSPPLPPLPSATPPGDASEPSGLRLGGPRTLIVRGTGTVTAGGGLSDLHELATQTTAHPDSDDPNHWCEKWRADAVEAQRQMNECYRAAGEAQRGQGGGTQLASVLMLRGNQHKVRMKAYHRQAAAACVRAANPAPLWRAEDRRSDAPPGEARDGHVGSEAHEAVGASVVASACADGGFEVDLHGLRCAEAVEVVKVAIKAARDASGTGPSYQNARLTFISGKGLHSRDGQVRAWDARAGSCDAGLSGARTTHTLPHPRFLARVCVLAPPATPQAKLQPALLRHLEEYEWPPAGGWEYRSGRFVVDLPGW